jgi:hypothetical protein
MAPITTIEEAFASIDAFRGSAEEFILPIADSLQDPVGLNLAIILDRILARGWWPNGYVQHDGYRAYAYKSTPPG